MSAIDTRPYVRIEWSHDRAELTFMQWRRPPGAKEVSPVPYNGFRIYARRFEKWPRFEERVRKAADKFLAANLKEISYKTTEEIR